VRIHQTILAISESSAVPRARQQLLQFKTELKISFARSL